MWINVRIKAFALASIVMVGMLLGNLTSAHSTPEVTAWNLKANNELEKIKQYFDALIADQEFLLDPNNSTKVRQMAHLQYVRDTEKLLASIDIFNKYISGLSQKNPTPEGMNLWVDWEVYQVEFNCWLKSKKKLHDMFVDLEATLLLNHELLWENLEQYRDEHFVMVQELSNMAFSDRPTATEITPGDTSCSLGLWVVRFNDHSDIQDCNPAMVAAMKSLAEHHQRFHIYATEIYNLTREAKPAHALNIDGIFTQLLLESNAVTTHFAIIKEGIERGRNIYNDIIALQQGEMARASAKSKLFLNEVIKSKIKLDEAT